MARGSREHPHGHTAHPGAALEWKADSQQLGTQMKSTSWVRSAISSNAQCSAPLQGMKKSIPPWSTSPLSIPPVPSRLPPKSEGFCTLWGTFVLRAHGKDPPAPGSVLTQLWQKGLTQTGYMRSHSTGLTGGRQCPPEAEPCPLARHERACPNVSSPLHLPLKSQAEFGKDGDFGTLRKIQSQPSRSLADSVP